METWKIIVFIVAALIVVSAFLSLVGGLAYFGVLKPDSFVPNRCSLGSNFMCANQQITQNSATLSLVNTQLTPVVLNSITFDGGCFDSVTVNTAESLENRERSSIFTFECNDGSNKLDELVEVSIRVGYVLENENVNRIQPGELIYTITQ